MKMITSTMGIAGITIAISFAACNNESATTEETKVQDTSIIVESKENVSQPAYDAAMDPYINGGEFVQKLPDTLGAKMYITTLKPGDSAVLHSHPDHAVYVLQGGQLAVTFDGQGRQIMDLPTGAGLINGPVNDAAKNTGKTTIKLLIVDVYRPRTVDNSFTYDAALDPITVGGNDVKKIADTLNIKLFDGIVRPGEKVPLHKHPDHAIYFLQGGEIELSAQGAAPQKVSLKSNTGWIGGPLIDSARNTGKTPIRFVEVDIYRARN